MAKRTFNNIKLGVFVISGLSFLIVMLYLVGKNRNLFSPAFELKTHFHHIQGLQPGNNVRYSGIQAGSVKSINILNDTLIEVILSIDETFKNIIRQNAVVSIGNDGFVGNKIVNITPLKTPAPIVEELSLLTSRDAIDTDEAMRTLYSTNNDIAVITHELKTLLLNINANPALLNFITSDKIPNDINAILSDVRKVVSQLNHSSNAINEIIVSVQHGKGNLGAILNDTAMYLHLLNTSEKMKAAGDEAVKITDQVHRMVKTLEDDIEHGKGPVQAMLKDTSMVTSMQSSLNNIEKGTAAFNQNMEALKSNFLFRGFFKKMERKEKKDSSSKN